jgi:hypothetical protein
MFAMLLVGFPSSKELGDFALNCLAVAGGFVVGYILGATLAFALDNWALNKKSPEVLKKSIRVLAGIGLALLIAFLVFKGGSGGGWGGGNGPEGPGSNGAQNPDNGQAEPKQESKMPKIDTPKSPELNLDDPKVRVTFLGGEAVQGDRFYLVDDEPVPKNFAEMKSIVLKRKAASVRPLTLIVQYPADPKQRIDPNSINVTQVTSWAEANGIGVYKPGK